MDLPLTVTSGAMGMYMGPASCRLNVTFPSLPGLAEDQVELVRLGGRAGGNQAILTSSTSCHWAVRVVLAVMRLTVSPGW